MILSTKINCGGCISKVQSDLDELLGAGKWSVDTSQPNKPLTFDDSVDVDDVLDILEKHDMIVEE